VFCKHLSLAARVLFTIACQTVLLAQVPGKFLGASSCSSSSCHGGGGQNQNQFTVWSAKDPHSRSFATLTSARSARIGEALQIKETARDVRCTVCHAPLHEVASEKRAPAADAVQGISCETCHNAAEPWIRAHTRKDYTHTQRVAAGMRDLRTAAGRAQTCVACHQWVEPTLLRAGHPELIFELDGQLADMTRHWNRTNDPPVQELWLAGQKAALRELDWQLGRTTNAQPSQLRSRDALRWLLAPLMTNQAGVLDQLTARAAEFTDMKTNAVVLTHRAERLVLGIDRLSRTENRGAKAEEFVKKLFVTVQDPHEFAPNEFAEQLEEFRRWRAGH
jgi:hypothetical protein